MASGDKPAAPGAGDLDLKEVEAVDNIPRDTLIALLKRKNKEVKQVQGKLDKLEERYVKVVRHNKILMDDRRSFQSFCSELLPESDGTFEEAAAQENPVNLDALLRQLGSWRSAIDAAHDDRLVFKQFIELVFPGDDAVSRVVDRSPLPHEAFDTLQQRWVALEDLHNQSIASVNAMAREQMMEGTQRLEAADAARQEAERKVEEMREQLTGFAREKAQILQQRLHGGTEPIGDLKAEGCGAVPPAAPVNARELEELKEARRVAEQRLRDAQESSDRRERDLLDEAEAQRAETRRIRRELEGLREEGERHRSQVRQLVEEKDTHADRLQRRIDELEEEVSGNAFITRCAEQQAEREVEVKSKQRQLEQLDKELLECQRLLGMSYEQERVLKARIRELELSHGRGHTAGDYLKHVVLKYIQYNQVGDMKAQTLVPVLSTLLNFSSEECRTVEGQALPQSLLLINQAVGGATSWLKGGSEPEKAGEQRAPVPTPVTADSGQ